MAIKILFNDPFERAFYLVHHLSESLIRCEDKMHKKTGLRTRQFGVLRAIKSLQDPITPTAVAEWLSRETGSITLMVDRMEKENLVSRVWDLDDRRSLRLSITEKGKKIFRQGRRHQRALSMEILSCLSPNELQELIRLMDKVLEKTYEIRKLKTKVKEIRVK